MGDESELKFYLSSIVDSIESIVLGAKNFFGYDA